MNSNKSCLGKWLWVIAWLCTSPAAWALKSDADQPVYIDSNAATYDDSKAISIYTGDVVATQGTLEVRGDRLEVYFKQGKIDKIIAKGKPARFQQQPDNGGLITGKALTGEYYPERSLLILIDQAVVNQDGNVYESDLIRYDSKNEIVKAGEQSSGNKRVRVILQPKNKN
ncbi:MAG: lipopolysaccharide transport periplasmic protein LptA [Methylococcales bacterium]|nr:lipopolysaccharide transport periplasmic protein LptA [Methylococcales bacterium]